MQMMIDCKENNHETRAARVTTGLLFNNRLSLSILKLNITFSHMYSISMVINSL